MFDLIVIGAGPAGLTAMVYALRARLNSILIEREACGGKMNLTNEISNYPGCGKIEGAKLSEYMLRDAERLGANIEYGEVIEANLNEKIKIIRTEKNEFNSVSVIVSNGLKTRYLKCPGEDKLIGRGVSYCATCDGFFFKGKKTAVIGGGNTALEDALYLSNICSEVTIIVRKNYFKGEKFLIDLLKETENINVLFETEVKEIKGEKFVTSFILEKNDQENEFPIDAVFIAIGQQPESKIFSEINTDDLGYFISDESCMTNIDGVFVAGDCRTKDLRQIVTAVSDGASAAEKAFKYCKQNKHLIAPVFTKQL
ncbi:MAG: FAD-dependent oxidoreductase [Oscillospiraceae bacterium]|nr:FAD-dependent oxidoreductase [Oscillospiraceae bacterium]